ncbi:MAG: guanylate kinase [Candidatus Magasanikbacteria bacterium]|jgi:guanylate kinase
MHPAIIISGPAGVGKSTVAKALQKQFPNLSASVTYTSRPPRPGAKEDKQIFYVNAGEFEKMIADGEFLEWAKVHENYYGTHKAKTMALLEANPVIFNIDVQGMLQLSKFFEPKNLITIFLLPESHEQMVAHIKRRGHIDPKDFANRLQSAERELSQSGLFQHQIVNGEGKLAETVAKIATIIQPCLAVVSGT